MCETQFIPVLLFIFIIELLICIISHYYYYVVSFMIYLLGNDGWKFNLLRLTPVYWSSCVLFIFETVIHLVLKYHPACEWVKRGGDAAFAAERRTAEDVQQDVVNLDGYLLTSPPCRLLPITQKGMHGFCRTVSSGNRQADRRVKPKRWGQSLWVQKTPLISSKSEHLGFSQDWKWPWKPSVSNKLRMGDEESLHRIRDSII